MPGALSVTHPLPPTLNEARHEHHAPAPRGLAVALVSRGRRRLDDNGPLPSLPGAGRV